MGRSGGRLTNGRISLFLQLSIWLPDLGRSLVRSSKNVLLTLMCSIFLMVVRWLPLIFCVTYIADSINLTVLSSLLTRVLGFLEGTSSPSPDLTLSNTVTPVPSSCRPSLPYTVVRSHAHRGQFPATYIGKGAGFKYGEYVQMDLADSEKSNHQQCC